MNMSSLLPLDVLCKQGYSETTQQDHSGWKYLFKLPRLSLGGGGGRGIGIEQQRRQSLASFKEVKGGGIEAGMGYRSGGGAAPQKSRDLYGDFAICYRSVLIGNQMMSPCLEVVGCRGTQAKIMAFPNRNPRLWGMLALHFCLSTSNPSVSQVRAQPELSPCCHLGHCQWHRHLGTATLDAKVPTAHTFHTPMLPAQPQINSTTPQHPCMQFDTGDAGTQRSEKCLFQIKILKH